MHPQISVMERPRHTTAAPDPADPPLALASAGSGPLLQRDYWGVIDGCRLSPREIIDLLAARFGEVAPPELVRFERADGAGTPLSVGLFAGTWCSYTGPTAPGPPGERRSPITSAIR